jgi:hypothetical protein
LHAFFQAFFSKKNKTVSYDWLNLDYISHGESPWTEKTYEKPGGKEKRRKRILQK